MFLQYYLYIFCFIFAVELNLYILTFNFIIMNKEIIKIVIKVLIYALGLIGSYLGISALASCSSSHSVEGSGKTTIVTTDTTYIYHGGALKTK